MRPTAAPGVGPARFLAAQLGTDAETVIRWLVVDRIATLRVLLIVTFRPEFEPPWIGWPHVTALTINRLTQREVSAMIDRLVGNKLLPASIRQAIVERTDGIPLFVEEMTKAVLEPESEGRARRTVAAVPSPALAVPASLHASLMARLDRLGPAKEVAQIGVAFAAREGCSDRATDEGERARIEAVDLDPHQPVPLERTDEADVALGLEVEIEIEEELDVLAGASCLSSASSTRSDGLIKIMERHALATRQLARASFCSAR